MLKIGITGGIGSGKSVVCRILESLGYPVFYSDAEAKVITSNHPEVQSGLIERYGEVIYLNGELNRTLLSEKIFNSTREKTYVNDLIHPKVREAFDLFTTKSKAPFIFNEAAILFETGSFKQFDKTFLVTASEELRIQRVMKRDNCAAEAVRVRMNSQWSDEKKIPLADAVIINNGQRSLLKQIEETLKTISAG